VTRAIRICFRLTYFGPWLEEAAWEPFFAWFLRLLSWVKTWIITEGRVTGKEYLSYLIEESWDPTVHKNLLGY